MERSIPGYKKPSANIAWKGCPFDYLKISESQVGHYIKACSKPASLREGFLIFYIYKIGIKDV
jgi:hypothetical protein